MIAGQFVGAFIGAILVYLAYLAALGRDGRSGLKLAVFSTGPAIRNTAANLITEIIGTVHSGVRHRSRSACTAAVAISAPSGALRRAPGPGIGMSLGGPTGYAINPARDLGPRIMHAILPIPGKGGSDWAYSWIPVVGPVVGGVIGGLLAKVLSSTSASDDRQL